MIYGIILFIFICFPIMGMDKIDNLENLGKFQKLPLSKQRQLINALDKWGSSENNVKDFLCPVHGAESKYSFRRHTHCLFSSKQLLMCAQCNIRYDNSRNLVLHYHNQQHETSWRCPACNWGQRLANKSVDESIKLIDVHVDDTHKNLVQMAPHSLRELAECIIKVRNNMHEPTPERFAALVAVGAYLFRESEDELHPHECCNDHE